MHFNENVSRKSKTDKNGEVYMKVTYPKYKFGEELVREVASSPTYGKLYFCVPAITLCKNKFPPRQREFMLAFDRTRSLGCEHSFGCGQSI